MSISCMNWAWQIQLPPTEKLVLMSLADNADDLGQCYPSMKYIAKRCCVSKRTGQRILKILKQKELVSSQYRNRKDGSNTSNIYTLNIGSTRGDSFTPPLHLPEILSKSASSQCKPVPIRHESVTPTPLKGVLSVTPITNKEPSKETTTTVDLIWPTKLNPEHCRSITSLSKDLNHSDTQLLIDEIAGQGNQVKNPVSYFRSLMETLLLGKFIPAKALDIQRLRGSKQRNQKAAHDAKARGLKELENLLRQKHEQR